MIPLDKRGASRQDKMDFVQPLLNEIDRQLAIEPKSTSSEKHESAIISASGQIGYRASLLRLRHAITASEWPHEGALRSFLVHPENLIWQIPAFSDNGTVIEPDYAKARTGALLKLRSRSKDKDIADDIWNNKEVTDWSLCTESTILIVWGTSQCLERLERFSVELVDHLTSEGVGLLTTNRYTTLYLLSPLPTEVYESLDSTNQGKDVLRHFALQSLRASCHGENICNIEFLLDILQEFKSSKIDDWFRILTKILAAHSHVNIIINTRTLGKNVRDAHQWPAKLLKLIQELKGKTVLRVMLISGRFIPSPVDPAIRTMAVGDSSLSSIARMGLFHLHKQSRRGVFSSPPGTRSDLDKVRLDDRTSEISMLSRDSSSGLPSNMQTDLFIPSNSTNSHVENPDDCNHPGIADQDMNLSKVVQDRDAYGLANTMEDLNLGVLQAERSGASEGSAQQWFKKLEATTHQVIYGLNSPSSTPIKVAVLDSGFAYTNAEDKKLLKPYYQRVKKFANFIDGDTELDAKRDQSGHGTAVAVQILKVSLSAVLYICRVASFDGTNTAPDTSAVERAIRKAAAKPDKHQPEGGGWGVDIINMSFGWSYQHHGVRQAIDFARQNGVHLFASTSNYGLLGPPNDILYPARSDNVIAIDAADGLGEHAKTAPSLSSQHSRGSRFSAPGLGLSSPNSEITWSGSSFACPIAAGVAALLLEFTRQPPLSESQSVQKCLQDTPAMLALLRRMSSEKGPDDLKFLTPWKLTDESSEERLFVSRDIVKELRNEYGPQVGIEISWRFH